MNTLEDGFASTNCGRSNGSIAQFVLQNFGPLFSSTGESGGTGGGGGSGTTSLVCSMVMLALPFPREDMAVVVPPCALALVVSALALDEETGVVVTGVNAGGT